MQLETGIVDIFKLALPHDAEIARPRPGLRAAIEHAVALLGPCERARAARLKVAAKRYEFILTRSALRCVLAHFVGTSATSLVLEAAEHGKPALARPRRPP